MYEIYISACTVGVRMLKNRPELKKKKNLGVLSHLDSKEETQTVTMMAVKVTAA